MAYQRVMVLTGTFMVFTGAVMEVMNLVFWFRLSDVHLQPSVHVLVVLPHPEFQFTDDVSPATHFLSGIHSFHMLPYSITLHVGSINPDLGLEHKTILREQLRF